MRGLPGLVMTLMAFVAITFTSAEEAFACRLGIGDRVWVDANRNGVQDAGEPGIDGVTVTISPGFWLNGDPATNVWVTSTVTGPSAAGAGYYLFNGVDCQADYTVAVDLSTVPAGLSPTAIGVGSDAAV